MRHEYITSGAAIAVLCALSGATYWFAEIANRETTPDLPPVVRKTPDYIIKNLRLTKINQQGVASYNVTADKAEHFNYDDHFNFYHPKIVTVTPNQPITTMIADQGYASSQATEIILEKNVVITRKDKSAPLVVKTEYLKVFPDDEKATTHAFVTATQGNSELKGIGMDINNVTRILNIHQQARGLWVSPKEK